MSSIITRPQPGDGAGAPLPPPDVNPEFAAHYLRAEQALEMAGDYDLDFRAEQWYLAAAGVHALLALAAATALPRSPEMPADGAR